MSSEMIRVVERLRLESKGSSYLVGNLPLRRWCGRVAAVGEVIALWR